MDVQPCQLFLLLYVGISTELCGTDKQSLIIPEISMTEKKPFHVTGLEPTKMKVLGVNIFPLLVKVVIFFIIFLFLFISPGQGHRLLVRRDEEEADDKEGSLQLFLPHFRQLCRNCTISLSALGPDRPRETQRERKRARESQREAERTIENHREP